MDEKRQELFNHYSEQFTKATGEDYKRHYRQLKELMKSGRTTADGRAVFLSDDMLDMLHLQYTAAKQARAEQARKAGSVTSEAKAAAVRRNGQGGGRPPTKGK